MALLSSFRDTFSSLRRTWDGLADLLSPPTLPENPTKVNSRALWSPESCYGKLHLWAMSLLSTRHLPGELTVAIRALCSQVLVPQRAAETERNAAAALGCCCCTGAVPGYGPWQHCVPSEARQGCAATSPQPGACTLGLDNVQRKPILLEKCGSIQIKTFHKNQQGCD